MCFLPHFLASGPMLTPIKPQDGRLRLLQHTAFELQTLNKVKERLKASVISCAGIMGLWIELMGRRGSPSTRFAGPQCL